MLNLGPQIKRLREQRGWSQRTLGSHLGISGAAVSKLENGQNQPSMATLKAISELFATHLIIGFTGSDVDADLRMAGMELGLDEERLQLLLRFAHLLNQMQLGDVRRLGAYLGAIEAENRQSQIESA